MTQITASGAALLALALPGCEKTAPNPREPFAEGRTLTCPPGTKKAEDLKSSYPTYYCVGAEGRSGTWMEFDVNGRIRTRAEYVNDKMEGPWVRYHSDGKIETKGQMKDGKRVGEWMQYYVNDAIRSTKTYVENEQTGPVRLYYQTGGLMAEGAFVRDKEEGPWKVYTPEGKLARECVMAGGLEKECVIHIKDFQPATYMYNSKEKGAL